jgi:CheY-like chemotaxis protein
LSTPVEILIVDDETIYRSALAGWIEEAPELNPLCKIHHAQGSDEALTVLKNHTIDLIITDIDMGPKSLTGFELVKDLRSTHQFKGLIFVHSNRIVPDDHRRAGDLGADGFLPKPMAKGQLFKLLLQTIQGLLPVEVPGVSLGEGASTTEGFNVPEIDAGPIGDDHNAPANLVAIIDDEDIFRDQWPAFLKGFETVCYSTAEDFLKDWDKLNGRLSAVLTDKYLGSGMDGVTLGTMLRAKSPNLVIILSTSDMGVKDPSNIFNLIVDKDAFEEAPKIIQYMQPRSQDEHDLTLTLGN